MLSGRSDVKYGLQLSAKAQKRLQPVGGKVQEKQIKTPSIFGDDEDEDIESEIARQALKKRSKREVEQQHAAALKEDASVFDYDGVYDDMKKTNDKKFQEKSGERQSRYIGQLLNKAKVRQQEQDIVHERMLTKERAKEDHLYGDKEKFVTRAYKEKLAEQAQWLEEEKRREALEAANDVTKKEDLSDFYRNLLHNNVAFGGTVEERKQAQKQVPDKAASTSRDDEADRPQTDRLLDRSTTAGAQSTIGSQSDGTVGEKKVPRDGQDASEAEKYGVRDRERESDREAERGEDGVRGQEHELKVLSKPEGPSVQNLGAEKVEMGVAESSGRVKDESSVKDKAAAARERYLARKKQRL